MSNNFKWYIENELNKALAWADSGEGKKWIFEHFGTLYDLLYHKRDAILGYEYVILFQTTPIYLGEALKPARIIVHLWHLYNDPESYFGVSSDEIESGLITISVIETGILDKADREKRELELRKKFCPVINPSQYGNRCISRNSRFDRVHEWYNNRDRLGKAINTLAYKCPFAFGWNEVFRKTPCFNYNKIDDFLPYGFKQRIETYVNTINKEDYIALNHSVASLIANGFHIEKRMLVEVLCRLLFSFTSEEDVVNAGLLAANIQIAIREQFIQSTNA